MKKRVLAMIMAAAVMFTLIPSVGAEGGDFVINGDGVLTAYNGAGGWGVTIPDGVTAIGESAFADCVSINGVSLPVRKAIPVIQPGETQADIPAFVPCERIGNSAFSGCINLSWVNFLYDVKFIGEKAFFNCPKMKSIQITGRTTEIGEQAFGFYTDNDGALKKVEGFTINGFKKSTAEAYAQNNGFIFKEIPTAGGSATAPETKYPKGHILGKEKAEIFDALEILKYLVGIECAIKPGNAAFAAACITGNGEPTIFDALEILKYLVGIPSGVQ